MELWDLLDEDGNSTGERIERGVLPDGYTHLGTDIWIVNSNNEILIQKRSSNKRHSPNVWAMTGGSVLAGENSKNAIVREVKEELDLEIQEKELQFIKRYKVKHKETSPVFIDTYLIKKDIDISDIIIQEEELSEVKWATWEECEKICDDGNFLDFRWEAVRDLLRCIKYIGENISVIVDRQLGSCHPKYKDHKYYTNYGYVPNTINGDGEEIDCYILGETNPLEKYTGKCIAIIHRLNDNDDKLVIVPEGKIYTDIQIEELTKYQEKYFESIIIR